MYSYEPPHMAVQKQDDQHEHTYSNYVKIQDVVQKTCLRRWTIGKSGERGSGISVLPARHDDDDYYYLFIYIVIHRQTVSLYRNSSVWLDTQGAWSWDQNTTNFTLDLVSYRSASKWHTQVGNYPALCSNFRLFTFLPYRIPECLIHSKSFCITRVAAVNSFARVLNPRLERI